jgi:predicted Zn-dependent protease
MAAAVLVLILTFQIGCSSPLVKALSDINIFTDAEELQFGKAYVAQHEKEIKLYTDPVVTNYINALGQSLVRHSKRSNISYTFKIVDKKGVNAYAVPGGFIYIHLDLIRMAKTESELAFVLGHEIGHIVGRHSMKRLTKIYGFEIIRRIILDEESSEAKRLIAEILTAGLLFRYSRDNERESDFYGVQNVYDASISPEGATEFFETLQNLQKREPSTLEKLISTHPVHSERITNVRSHIKNLPPKSGLRSNSSDFRKVKRRLGQ